MRLIIISCLISCSLNAQFSIAGVNGGNYHDVVPDTFLNDQSNSTPDEEYLIDLNLDATPEISVKSHHQTGGAYTQRHVSVICLNSNTKVVFDRTDSTYIPFTSYWLKRDILKKYSYKDTINSLSLRSSGYLGFGWIEYGTPVQSNQWIDSVDKYIGVQYTDGLGTRYGWIRVNVTNHQEVLIKDYSLGDPLNISVENKVNSDGKFKVFPNPSSGKVSYELNSNDNVIAVKIIAADGRIIQNIPIINYSFDFSGQGSGIYLIEIVCDKRVLRSIIQIIN